MTMKLIKRITCVVMVAVVAALSGLACESETTVSHEEHTTHVSEPKPVLEGD
jgi:hypothetical protein